MNGREKIMAETAPPGATDGVGQSPARLAFAKRVTETVGGLGAVIDGVEKGHLGDLARVMVYSEHQS